MRSPTPNRNRLDTAGADGAAFMEKLVTPTPLVLYLASFATADAAEEDFDGVRRLKRDRVIGTAVAGIIVRQAAGWIWCDAATPITRATRATVPTAARADDLLAVLVAQTSPDRDSDGGATRAVPMWLENEVEEEFREQLTTAGAAVVVLAEEQVAPALRVALARAHSFVQRRLTKTELHRAAAQQLPDATTL
jgi:hypothetical protein